MKDATEKGKVAHAVLWRAIIINYSVRQNSRNGAKSRQPLGRIFETKDYVSGPLLIGGRGSYLGIREVQASLVGNKSDS